MDVALLLKVIGVALIVTVSHGVLSRSGRDDQAMLVSVAGAIIVFVMLISKVGDLIGSIRAVFGI